MFLNLALDQFFSMMILYFVVYNVSLMLFFWMILSFFNNLPMFNFSMLSISSNNFFKMVVSILFLSLSGLPPFMGFFTKMMLLNFLMNNYSMINMALFFLMMLLFLYFYMQNLKIVFSNKSLYNSYQFNLLQIKLSKELLFSLNSLMFVMIFSMFYMDDLLIMLKILIM